MVRPADGAPHHDIVAATRHPTTDERRILTDHVTPHNQDDGLFRAAGHAEERQPASDATDVKPVTRPSRDLFLHAVDQEVAEHHQPATQRDEAAMRSLRFPFDEGR